LTQSRQSTVAGCRLPPETETEHSLSSPSRMLIALLIVSCAFTLTGVAAANPSTSLEQVRNGQASSATTPTTAWANGNAGSSNSHYLESHSDAYRCVMDQLPTDGTTIELVIGYDVKRGGYYAMDYLTHYQRLQPHVGFAHTGAEVINPLDGVSGVPATFTTAPIPIPS